MEWKEVVEDPSLRDLPYKIETNEWGQIVMTPASGRHAMCQGYIIEWLNRLARGGRTLPECPIQTSKGVRVADVAWTSAAFLKKYGAPLSFPESPEIVIEVLSPSNSTTEMEDKRRLYFEAGAREFWLCDEYGNVRFFNLQGELKRSEFIGEFPRHIDIDVV
ncbi:MAG: Uma2 family endonuclease [Syntrophobacteraceae bacterium]|nr:Uma2 family endonuclease [Syntrophobacteraceae bacterium]